MLGQGLMLMFAGIGTVSVFLVLMVLVMLAVGRYYQANESRYAESAVADKGRPQKTGEDSGAIVAAIVAALHVRSD